MTQLVKDDAYALVAAPIAPADTTITVDSANADRFPVANTGTDPVGTLGKDWFKATIEDNLGVQEIIYVRTRTLGSGVFSNVLRAQEGTAALTAAATTTVCEQRFTAKSLQDALNAVDTSLQKSGGTMTGDLILAADANAALEATTKQQLDAVESALTTAIAALSSATTSAIQAAQAAAVSAAVMNTGAIQPFARSTAPTGWVKANFTTIGNAASGAVQRANADTVDLFTLLWNEFSNTLLPIQDSAGVASARGASAAADYAANKRLPVPEIRAEFVRGLDDGRGVDAGRVLGSYQASAIEAHSHSFALSVPASIQSWQVGAGSTTMNVGSTSIAATQSTGGAETRGRNFAALICIKL